MKYIIILFVLLLIPSFQAETTFYENPSEVLIISNFTASNGIIGEEINEAINAIHGGWCRYNWNCTDWGECLPEGKRIRNCTNNGNCFGNYGIPKLEKDCDYVSLIEGNPEQSEIVSVEETDNRMFFFIIISLTIVVIALIILYLKKYRLYYTH